MRIFLHQCQLFFNALAWFTRLPIPKWVEFSPVMQSGALGYFPWIGLLVGCLSALVYWLASLVLPVTIAILLSMITSIRLTGALHEDGLADCIDGFGGGWQRPEILGIMKDSHIGSYAVIGLTLVLLLKFNTLSALKFPITLIIAAHCLSRFSCLLIVYKETYVGLEGQSKSEHIIHSFNKIEFIVAFIPVLLSMLLLPWTYIGIIIPPLIISLYLGYYFRSRIGGYTGDCLGCCQQLTELSVYIYGCILWG